MKTIILTIENFTDEKKYYKDEILKYINEFDSVIIYCPYNIVIDLKNCNLKKLGSNIIVRSYPALTLKDFMLSIASDINYYNSIFNLHKRSRYLNFYYILNLVFKILRIPRSKFFAFWTKLTTYNILFNTFCKLLYYITLPVELFKDIKANKYIYNNNNYLLTTRAQKYVVNKICYINSIPIRNRNILIRNVDDVPIKGSFKIEYSRVIATNKTENILYKRYHGKDLLINTKVIQNIYDKKEVIKNHKYPLLIAITSEHIAGDQDKLIQLANLKNYHIRLPPDNSFHNIDTLDNKNIRHSCTKLVWGINEVEEYFNVLKQYKVIISPISTIVSDAFYIGIKSFYVRLEDNFYSHWQSREHFNYKYTNIKKINESEIVKFLD